MSLPARLWLLIVLCLGLPSVLLAQQASPDPFDDRPLDEPIEHPDWFEQSFLNLREDLTEAINKDKQGLVVYFGQKRCAYCKMLMQSLQLADIASYSQRHFNWVGVDIWGQEEVTDLQGQTLSERDFSVREGANFTPSLIFYDKDGKQALMLRGYYPPYQLRAALEYVSDGHYQKEPFPAYLARGDAKMTFEPGDLNPEDFFSPPPYNLDRSRIPAERLLAVFFEQGECHACDVLHGYALREPKIQQAFTKFDSIQLDIWSDKPLITPDGRRTTARDWARQLGLFYTPSVIFFDQKGQEIIRVDSVAHFYRLEGVLRYLESRGYLTEPNFMNWRHSSN